MLSCLASAGNYLFSQAAVQRGADTVRGIYQAAGRPEQSQHRWGPEGHRFCKNLMWPFVLESE